MEQITRKITRAVSVGGVTIGGGAPVVVQSMTNTRTADAGATLAQINRLYEAGCELVRVAVPDQDALKALPGILTRSPLPVIADVHFDHEIAIKALDAGCFKVRINPGNIGGADKFIRLAKHAKRLKVPLRVGVNAGSLERRLLQKHGGATAQALVESALDYISILENINFYDTVLSLKASDVFTTIAAYRLIAQKTDYPLHLGVTEAGPLQAGTIKSAIGIGACLADGIGDTIRVSLSASPEKEIPIAQQILQALGLRRFGPELISCPTCGRCEIDLPALVSKVEEIIRGDKRHLKIAVMGCTVNGPGEARQADIGISAGKKHGLLFRRGEVIRTVEQNELLSALAEELKRF